MRERGGGGGGGGGGMVVTLCPWRCLHTWSDPLCRWDLTHITHIQTHRPVLGIYYLLILSIVKSTNNYQL